MYLRLNNGNRRLNDLLTTYGIINPYLWIKPSKAPLEEENKRWSNKVKGMLENAQTLRPSIPVNLIELDDSYIVQADLPGYTEDSIRIDLDNDNSLNIEAERLIDENARYLVKERMSNRIKKFVTIPGQVDLANCEAEYKDGVLTILLPKDKSEKARYIQIKKQLPAE